MLPMYDKGHTSPRTILDAKIVVFKRARLQELEFHAKCNSFW